MGAQQAHSGGDDAVVRELRHQARATPPLRSGEQETLLARSALGDRSSQERLVATHLALVIRLAEARQEHGLSVSDLIQEGSLGLVEAIRSFAAGDSTDFPTFAEQKIGAQMDAALAAEAAAVRDAELLVAAASDYERTEILLRRLLQRLPSEAEIAEKLEWTVERTRYVAQVVADARRRHDQELLAFMDPEAIEIDDTLDG